MHIDHISVWTSSNTRAEHESGIKARRRIVRALAVSFFIFPALIVVPSFPPELFSRFLIDFLLDVLPLALHLPDMHRNSPFL
jgi:hypothetical protein